MPSENTGGASDNAPNTAAAPDTAAMQKMIDDAIGRALAARLPRVKNTEETLATMVADAVTKALAAKPAEQGGNVADPSPTAPKSVREADERFQAELKKLKTDIESERKARSEAENRERQVRLKSSVESQFAKHLGPDSPHLGPYVAHYMSQFVDRDGQVVRKIAGAFEGDEQYIPAEVAVGELFKSELKHLAPSRTQNLPPNSLAHLRGGPLQSPQSNGHHYNPIYGEAAQHFSQGNPGFAAALADAAVKPPK